MQTPTQMSSDASMSHAQMEERGWSWLLEPRPIWVRRAWEIYPVADGWHVHGNPLPSPDPLSRHSGFVYHRTFHTLREAEAAVDHEDPRA